MRYKIIVAISLLFCLAISTTASTQETQDVPIKSLGTYKKGGQTWTNILIPRKVNREKLIKMAKELHKSEPNTNFRFFDDDKQFQQFKDWDISYPNPAYPYPQKWVKEHHVANLQRMAYDSTGPKWVLLEGYTTEKIADIFTDQPPPNSPSQNKRVFSHNEEIVTELDHLKNITTVRLKPMRIANDSTGEQNLAALFVYSGNTPTRPDFITFQIISISSQWQFRNGRELVLFIDGQRASYGEMNNDISRIVNNSAAESISLNLQFEDFKRISNAKKVEGTIGQKVFVLQEKQLEALRDLASRATQ